MKVDQDLRIVIKHAADASKRNGSHWELERQKRESVATFLKRYPEKAKRIEKLRAAYKRATAAVEKIEHQLESQYGLGTRRDDDISNDQAFVKAGGKPPKSESFTADQVIAECAAAKTAAEVLKVLAKYSIVWK